jgi:hypothetical protein
MNLIKENHDWSYYVNRLWKEANQKASGYNAEKDGQDKSGES